MSAFHQNLKIIDIPNKGKGVIVLADIPANTVIFEFKGNKFVRENMTQNALSYLQVGKDRFLGPSGDLDDYINHSCNPNCGLNILGDRAFLVTLHLVKLRTEITFDFSTSSNDTLDQWQMDCKCGEFKCRKVISGYQYLDKEIKERYEKLGIVPSYLIGK